MSPALPPGEIDWPVVAVQLPIFNEKQIALRLIDQIVQLDYPIECLHIQILDDSTDETADLVARRQAYWKAKGFWITLHTRPHRQEYKAGALREALTQTPADLIAVFDADFLPAADWLKKAISPFLQPGSEHVGFVQTRWGHLNDRFSLLTNAQALFLDAHFAIEQPVCTAYGWLNYMNGTGFILRRACAIDAGNWSGATLVEDMDLCLRAQICGWKGVYLCDVSAPAELPGLFSGYKSQQTRWAKGAMQIIRLQIGKLLHSPLPLHVRIEAIFHLSSYLLHPLMLLLLLLALPLYMWSNDWLVKLPIRSLGVIGLAMPFFYISAHLTIYPRRRWSEIILRLPAISLLGIGMAVTNTLALLEGLRNRPAVFERTPKMGILPDDRLSYKKMRVAPKISKGIWLEVIFAIYAVFATVTTLQGGNYLAAYFFALYVFGFSWVAGAELIENLIAARNSR